MRFCSPSIASNHNTHNTERSVYNCPASGDRAAPPAQLSPQGLRSAILVTDGSCMRLTCSTVRVTQAEIKGTPQGQE